MWPLCTALSSDIYLTHRWPFTNGNMNDTIGDAHMTQGISTAFITDRFGVENSALSLNKGYTILPSQIYFDTPEFSVSVWVYYLPTDSWARFIDMGNGCNLEEIELAQQAYISNQPYFEIYNVTQQIYHVQSASLLQINSWQFFVATFDGSYANIYINGILAGTSSLASYTPKSLKRMYNYVGKSNCPNDGYSYSYLDDLRFFNTSLNQSQIDELMNYVNLTTITYFFTTTQNSSNCF